MEKGKLEVARITCKQLISTAYCGYYRGVSRWRTSKTYWPSWIVGPCSRKQSGMIGTANLGIVKYPWPKVLTTGLIPLSKMNKCGWIWSRSRANELHIYHSTCWLEKHHEINYIPDSWMSGASKYHKCPLIGPKMEELWVHQLVFPKDPDFLRKLQCHAMPMFGSCPALWFIRMNDQTTVINMVSYCCKSVCSIYSQLKYLHLGCRCISIEHTLHLFMYLSCRSSYISVYPSNRIQLSSIVYLSKDLDD